MLELVEEVVLVLVRVERDVVDDVVVLEVTVVRVVVVRVVVVTDVVVVRVVTVVTVVRVVVVVLVVESTFSILWHMLSVHCSTSVGAPTSLNR